MKETTNKETKSNDPSIIRKNNIEQRLEQGEYIYTHKYHTEDRLSDIVKKYEKMEEIPDGETVKAAGRVMGIRKSKNWDFIDVLEAGTTIQCIVKKNEQPEELLNTNSDLYRGDIIGFEGYMIRTRTGHLSINITDLKLLTPCVRTLATQYYGIKDTEYLYRRRYIDLIINKESRNRFLTRSRIIKYLRHFLDSRDFIEVETPILDTTVGGANAKPFLTYHNELKLDMYMRVSPELYHKKLIVGGLERVYEVGRLFRNEGVDLTHNPEFTSCEFYMAYADYYDLVELTETFLSGLVKELFNSHIVKYSALKHGTEEHTEVVMDFTTPFKKIDMLDELTLQTGIELNGSNIESAEALQEMIDFCEKEGIIVEEPKTTARVIDKLVGHFIEPSCINPTFITNHPSIMSPLAKSHRTKKGLTERFELFMNGKEICNAYTELNDPFDQRRRFEAQAKDKMSGDGEAMMTDQSFIEALEFGLPPTGGWGIGIDRLVMYLTGASNIRDVILFPTMKPETN